MGWFKWFRALATRYDKPAVYYTALWIIASIQCLLLAKIPGKYGTTAHNTL
jgi:hypothetical protein